MNWGCSFVEEGRSVTFQIIHWLDASMNTFAILVRMHLYRIYNVDNINVNKYYPRHKEM